MFEGENRTLASRGGAVDALQVGSKVGRAQNSAFRVLHFLVPQRTESRRSGKRQLCTRYTQKPPERLHGVLQYAAPPRRVRV